MLLPFIFKGTFVFLGALVCAYLLALTINVWVSLLVAILIASAVRPAILKLMQWRVPQGLAVLIVYGLLAVSTIIMLVIILPPVVNQFVSYLENDNQLATRIISAQSWVQQTVTQFTGSEFELGMTPKISDPLSLISFSPFVLQLPLSWATPLDFWESLFSLSLWGCIG